MATSMAFFNVLKCKRCDWHGFQQNAEIRHFKGKTHIMHCPKCDGQDFLIAAHAATDGVSTFITNLKRYKANQ